MRVNVHARKRDCLQVCIRVSVCPCVTVFVTERERKEGQWLELRITSLLLQQPGLFFLYEREHSRRKGFRGFWRVRVGGE